MSEPWRPAGEDAWRDGGLESWRGDLHHTDDASWRSDSSGGWQDPDSDDATDPWAVEDEPGEWPEEKAGPEYWMYRRNLEGDK